ncbi:MAG: DoxX family protein [Elainellaceae cyanobacterium]
MSFQTYIPLIARTFLTVIFLRSGISKLLSFSGTQETIANAGIPLPVVALILTILFEIVGAVFVILGFKARWGALLLLLFIIPATLVFHNPVTTPEETTQFFKNLSIMGGLLFVISYGSGPLSLSKTP